MTKFKLFFCFLLLGASLSAMAWPFGGSGSGSGGGSTGPSAQELFQTFLNSFDACVKEGKQGPLTVTKYGLSHTFPCCAGLEGLQSAGEPNKICRDPSIFDETLISCSGYGSKANCPDKQGCYPMSLEDMFVNDQKKHDDLAKQMEDNAEELRKDGQFCKKASQCESNYCQRLSGPAQFLPLPGKCERRLICRLAAKEEIASNQIDCKEGLNKHPQNNRCLSDDVYPGLIIDFKPKPVPGKMCQWEMNPEHMKIANETFKARTAMRHMWANAIIDKNGNGNDEDDDCMRINPYFKRIGKFMEEKEKAALTKFNLDSKKLEDDRKTLEDAIADSKSATPNPHKAITFNGKPTTNQKLMADIGVGLPALYLQRGANAVRGEWEIAQRAIGMEVARRLEVIRQDIEALRPFALNWKVDNDLTDGVNQLTDKNEYKVRHVRCRSTFAFILNPQAFMMNMYLFLRWGSFFQIDGLGKYNREMFEKDNKISDILTMISGELKPKILRDFVSIIPVAPQAVPFFNMFMGGAVMDSMRMHLQIDPMLPFTPTLGFAPMLPFQQAFPRFGLMGATKENSYTGMYEKLGVDLNKYNYSLYEKPDGFKFGDIFRIDPEVFKREDADCFIDPSLPKCFVVTPADPVLGTPEIPSFNQTLTRIQNHLFANVVAHGQSKGANITNLWFSGSWRRRQIAGWKVNFANLESYYKGMQDYRVEAEKCLDKVILDIETNLTNTTTTIETTAGSNSGATSGATSGSTSGAGNGSSLTGTNYYGSGVGANVNTGPHTSSNSSGNPTSYSSSHNSLASLQSGMLSAIGHGGKMSGILTTNTGAGGGQTSISADALQASRKRLKDMQDANAIAATSGIDVAAKEAAVRESIQALSGQHGGGGAGSNLGSSSKHGAGSDSGIKATLDEIAVDPNAKNNSGANTNASSGNNGAGQNGPGGPSLMNYGSQSSGSTSSTTNGNGIDSTGLSAEEQKAILENAERNKAKNDEFTSLFDIISNSYKNNLIKVFGSKKEID